MRPFTLGAGGDWRDVLTQRSPVRYASLDSGATSHKKVEKKRSKILNLYYSNNVCNPLLIVMQLDAR